MNEETETELRESLRQVLVSLSAVAAQLSTSQDRLTSVMETTASDYARVSEEIKNIRSSSYKMITFAVSTFVVMLGAGMAFIYNVQHSATLKFEDVMAKITVAQGTADYTIQRQDDFERRLALRTDNQRQLWVQHDNSHSRQDARQLKMIDQLADRLNAMQVVKVEAK